MEYIGGFAHALFAALALLTIAIITALAVMALWGAWLDRSVAAWEAILLAVGVMWLAWSAAAGVRGEPLRTLFALGTMFAAWSLGIQLRRRSDRAIA